MKQKLGLFHSFQELHWLKKSLSKNELWEGRFPRVTTKFTMQVHKVIIQTLSRQTWMWCQVTQQKWALGGQVSPSYYKVHHASAQNHNPNTQQTDLNVMPSIVDTLPSLQVPSNGGRRNWTATSATKHRDAVIHMCEMSWPSSSSHTLGS